MEEIKTDQEKIWLTVFEENYPFMRSLIERTLGELRYKDFVDCMDLVVDLAVSKERERIVEILENNRNETLWGDEESNEVAKKTIDQFIIVVKDELNTE